MHRLIEQHPLRRGAHPTRDDGMCAMEMVAWLAGEPHSDEPGCACPVVAAFVRATNDALGDAARDRHLRPLVPMLVNTRATAAVERARGLLVVDALVRDLLPRWLVRQRRPDEARLLRDLPAVHDATTLRAAQRAVEHYATDCAAARWVLQRAVDGLPAARFVAGAVQVARLLHDVPTWTAVGALIERLARCGADRVDELRGAVDA
jgi:hypothetical protein